MKAATCDVSPLLLIENKRSDWPTLPNSADREFGDQYTIGAEALLCTYCAVVPVNVSPELVRFVEGVRTKRNAIVHGIAADELSPVSIIEMVLKSHTFLIAKDSWWFTMRDQYISDPLFGLMDSDYEMASFGRRLDYVESVLGKAKLSTHFTQDLKARRYYCPSCKDAIESGEGSMDSKWAYLKPNEPTSTGLFFV
jgi:hypothetical protein